MTTEDNRDKSESVLALLQHTSIESLEITMLNSIKAREIVKMTNLKKLTIKMEDHDKEL